MCNVGEPPSVREPPTMPVQVPPRAALEAGLGGVPKRLRASSVY
ncbi:MAG TPA: hypothetical protein VK735_36990 [Pseudonocardia sp.]|nr:hypothetical protein [Pseudonocardia sp.]